MENGEEGRREVRKRMRVRDKKKEGRGSHGCLFPHHSSRAVSEDERSGREGGKKGELFEIQVKSAV